MVALQPKAHAIGGGALGTQSKGSFPPKSHTSTAAAAAAGAGVAAAGMATFLNPVMGDLSDLSDMSDDADADEEGAFSSFSGALGME